jgi:PAS domain S-box-containing protein
MTDGPYDERLLDDARREANAAFGIGLYGFTLDGTLLFIDVPAFRLFSLEYQYPDPAAVRGRSFSELPGEQVHMEICRQLREQAVVRGQEWPLLLSSGEIRWVFEDARRVQDPPGGRFGGIEYGQSLVRNVTVRKYKEALLLGDQTKYQTIVETMHEGYYEIDLDERLVFLNRALANLLGDAEERLLGVDFFKRYCPPEYIEKMRSVHLSLAAGEAVNPAVELVIARPDGSEAVLDVSVAVMNNRRGVPKGFRGICRDVTDRTLAEAAAQAAEARYNQLFEEANDIVYTHDLQGYFTSLNEAGERISGYRREELYRRRIFDIIAPEQRETVRQMVEQKMLAGDGSTQYELTVVTKDGRRVPLEVNTRLLFVGDRPVGVQGIARDITDRRHAEEQRLRLEQQILHAQKLEGLGVLAGGIAHDFNNLLVGVLGNAGLALRRLPKDSPLHTYLKRIEAAAQRAALLTKQMLAYSGRSSFVVRPLNLSKLIADMPDLVRASIPRQISLEFDCDPGLPLIVGDTPQFHQMLVNLITNAAEAIGERAGRIVVRTSVTDITAGMMEQFYFQESCEPGAYVCLEIADDGCGMGKEQLARVFDPFYTTKFTGRGLGLAALLGIVRGHRGAIQVESRLGEGTVFRLYFPVVARAAASAAPLLTPPSEIKKSAAVGAWQGSGLLLIADDEEAVRVVAKEILERQGFTTLVAVDGREAIDMFTARADEVAAALIDLTMPQINGQEVMEALRALRPELPIIITSGYSEQDILERFHQSPPTAFIQKPYRSRELVALVKKVLGGS